MRKIDAQGVLPAASGPCPRCGADDWRPHRRGWWPSLRDWLRGGGRWRPVDAACVRCGHRVGGQSVAWLVSGSPRRRWTVPLRLPRALLRALAGQRTAEPAPWLSLAASGVGGLLGASAGQLTRRFSGARSAVVGATAGGAALWTGFTATTLRRPDTWDRLVDALLVEVAPGRARRRQRQQEVERVRSANLPLYGLGSSWTGSRWLGGSGWGWSSGHPRPVVMSVTLGHGDPRGRGPWVEVEVATRRDGRHADDRHLADELWHRGRDQARASAGLGREELLVRIADERRARAARPDPRWQERTIPVDGRPLAVRWLGEGGLWVAYADLSEHRLVLQGDALAIEDLALVRVTDLTAYLEQDDRSSRGRDAAEHRHRRRRHG